MIVAHLAQAQGVLTTYTQYLQDRQQTQDLDKTLDALKGLRQLAETFAQRYALVRPRLAAYLPPDYSDRILAARQKTLISYNNFVTSPWQVTNVNEVRSDLMKLMNQLTATWTTYANQAIRPKQELYGLLKELPEVRKSSIVLERMLRNLDDQTRALPTSDHELQRFDDQLNDVTEVLTNVDGITDAVRDFLVRVHQATFTVADLSDEVLAWYRVNNRGASFRIRA